MGDLLKGVIEAHGGLENWAGVESVTARVSVDGPFWDWRGLSEIRQPQTITADAHRVRITLTPFAGDGLTASFGVAPERVKVVSRDGTTLVESDDPLASFPVYEDTVAWGLGHLAYFMGTANWNYLTAPFLFTYPGVEAREIEPWQEGGETWRRLAVTFPASLPNHNPEQTFYYGDDFLLRRMDYSPVVTGHSLIAHYTHAPKVFDGFVFYTHRLVHLRDEAGNADQSFTAISIDTESVTVTRK